MWPISTTPSLTDMMGSDLWILIITRVKVLKHRLGCWLAAQRGKFPLKTAIYTFRPLSLQFHLPSFHALASLDFTPLSQWVGGGFSCVLVILLVSLKASLYLDCFVHNFKVYISSRMSDPIMDQLTGVHVHIHFVHHVH